MATDNAPYRPVNIATYFARAGSVVNVCETGKRKARAPISPPGGVSNSMVPRMFAVTGTGPSPA